MDARGRQREQRIDRILVGVAGLATTVIAAGATSLVLSPEPNPQFGGAEHLAIFARPSRGLPETTARAALEHGVDATPVGGLGGAPARPAQDPKGEKQARWRVHDVVGTDVFLIGPDGLVVTRIGTDLGEAGVIEGVVVERGGYAIITSKGRIGPAR